MLMHYRQKLAFFTPLNDHNFCNNQWNFIKFCTDTPLDMLFQISKHIFILIQVFLSYCTEHEFLLNCPKYCASGILGVPNTGVLTAHVQQNSKNRPMSINKYLQWNLPIPSLNIFLTVWHVASSFNLSQNAKWPHVTAIIVLIQVLITGARETTPINQVIQLLIKCFVQ